MKDSVIFFSFHTYDKSAINFIRNGFFVSYVTPYVKSKQKSVSDMNSFTFQIFVSIWPSRFPISITKTFNFNFEHKIFFSFFLWIWINFLFTIDIKMWYCVLVPILTQKEILEGYHSGYSKILLSISGKGPYID